MLAAVGMSSSRFKCVYKFILETMKYYLAARKEEKCNTIYSNL
jgi:hypothetical protein